MTYAKGGILTDNPKDILINTAFRHDCNGAEIFINGLQIADIAWVLTLKKANILNDIDEVAYKVDGVEYEFKVQDITFVENLN